MSIEAMKQALEALDGLSEPYDVLKAQDALRQAIEQAEKQEPVAWVKTHTGGVSYDLYHDVARQLPEGVEFDLYTHPPKEWVGLTNEEVWDMECYKLAMTYQETSWLYRFARAIEAKLKAKNGFPQEEKNG